MAEAKLEARDGRTAILITAERMFAIYGLHGASLRQISEEAGQKNTSAIQYHFGSRDKLIEAVFAMRMTRINPRRQAVLDDLTAHGRLGDVRSLVGAMVRPMAEELHPRPEGNHYLQFMSRTNQERLLVLELAPPELMTAWHAVIDHLKAAIRYLPPEIARTRIMLAGEQCVSALAAFEAEGAGASKEFAFRVETLIDMIAAGIAAPVSAATLAAQVGKAGGDPA